MNLLLPLLTLTILFSAREPLAERIARQDPERYRKIPHVHGGAGELHYLGLFGADAFHSNLLFLHAGVIPPKGGIGHHFHNQMEEMFVILDNEAEFTISGRTSRLEGPAAAPCRKGHSHAIYNPTEKPTQWLNIAVSSTKGNYDAFDLDDDRVGVPLDEKPVFISVRFDRKLLRPQPALHGGKGEVLYRRVLDGSVFYTHWAYVDHAVVPAGASIGPHRHAGVEEFFYVMAGEGTMRVNDETEAIRKGNAVPILLNDVHAVENTSEADLELLIVGVALEKAKLDTVDVP